MKRKFEGLQESSSFLRDPVEAELLGGHLLLAGEQTLEIHRTPFFVDF